MAKTSKLSLIASGIALSALVVSFQNCGQASFSSENQPVSAKGLSATQDFRVETTRTTTQTDILFVVDESVSMSVVLTPLRQGFEALAASAYPQDVRMAVTNMAPAFYLDVINRTVDLSKSFYNTAATTIFTQQPGFVSLVSASTINNFKTLQPTHANRFPIAGCASAWFEPTEKNADNVNCLTAHTQIALFGTGVEAGVISLDQLVNRSRTSGSRLFREGSLVNVVFVSDTHEPGAAYFGRAGAPAAMFSFQSVVDNIVNSNPGVLGVKFHGIVPLPPAGHAALNGVNTAGILPVDLAGSNVSGELMHDFSYLPFIGRSGGVAMHPVGNNWASILPQVLRETVIQRSPVVRLQRLALRIRKVIANGAELPATAYSLAANQQDLQIGAQIGWPQTIDVRVEYDPAE